MSRQWYLSRRGQQFGPYTWEEVVYYARSGNIEGGDLLWSQSTGEWIRADQVTGLLPPTSGYRPPRPKRRKKTYLIAGTSVLAVLLVVASILYIISNYRNGYMFDLPAMPPIEIEHESGARLNAPEGAFFEDTQLTISTRDDAPSAEPFELVGPSYEVDGVTLYTSQKPLILDIPSSLDEDEVAVMFYSLGEWIRIPSKSINLSSGESGRQVQIDGVPFPWLITVARLPEEAIGTPDTVEGEDVDSLLARLEQLRITDLEAFRAEMDKLDNLENLASFETDTKDNLLASNSEFFPLLSENYISQRDPFEHREPISVTRWELREARYKFLRAYHLISGIKYGHEERRLLSATRLYREGLEHLWIARTGITKMSQQERNDYYIDDRADRGSLRDDRLDDLRETSVYGNFFGGSLPINDMVEYYCGTFAPWGLQLTIMLLGDEEESRLVDDFDIRVLPFYGHEDFTDIFITEREIPLQQEDVSRRFEHWTSILPHQQRIASEMKFIESEVYHLDTLRFYSPRVFRITTAEFLSMAKSAVGGTAAILAIGKLSTTVLPVGATISKAYTVMAPFVERLYAQPFARDLEDKEITSQKTALTVYEGMELYGSVLLDPLKEITLRGAITNYVFDITELALSFFIDPNDIIDIQELRNAGATTGYKDAGAGLWQPDRFPVPPIMIISNITGPTEYRPHPNHPKSFMHPGDLGTYTLGGHARIEMNIDYDFMSPTRTYDLSGLLRSNYPEEIFYKRYERVRPDYLYGAYLTPFRENRWTKSYHDNAPHLQVIQWNIPEEELLLWSEEAEKDSLEEFLDSVTVEVHRVADSEKISTHYSTGTIARFQRSTGNTLLWHQVSVPGVEAVEGQRSFAVAINNRAPDIVRRRHRFEINLSHMTPEGMGQWSSIPLYDTHKYAALKYIVRILYKDEVLALYPAEFMTENKSIHEYESDRDRIRIIEVARVIEGPTVECSGTYVGEVVMDDPTMSQMGLDPTKMELTITISEDEKAEMNFSYSQSFGFDLGEGFSVGQSWESEGNLSGECIDGEIQMQGTQVTKIDVGIPDIALEEEIPAGALDQTNQVTVTGQVLDDVIEGTFFWEDEHGTSDLKFTARKVD